MKRSLLIIMTMVLTACGSDESSQSRQEASKQFDQAYTHFVAAGSGYIADTGYQGSLVEYQLKELAQASQLMSPLVRQGTDGQKLSAANALAEIEASRARHLARQAFDEWTTRSTISAELLTTLVAARQAYTEAEAHAKIDNTPTLTDARQEKTTAEAEQREADNRIAMLQDEVASHDKTRAQAESKRATLDKEAAEVRNQAFAASGQLRYDLYQQASQLSREADQLGVKVDTEKLIINRLQAQIGIAQIESAHAKDRVDAMQLVIDTFNQRKQSISRTSTVNREAAEELAARVVGMIQAHAEEHAEFVSLPFGEAQQAMSDSVSAIRNTRSLASSSDRNAVSQAIAYKQQQNAVLVQQYALTERSYANLLQVLVDQTREGFPAQQGAAVQTLWEDAQERASQIEAEAADAMESAADALESAESGVRDLEESRAMVEQAMDLYEAALAVRDNEETPERLDALQQRLEEIDQQIADEAAAEEDE